MKHILTCIIFILGMTGCMGRKVVINPDEISHHNDVDWNVINDSTSDTSPLSPENSIEQWELKERNNSEWIIGE